MPDPVINGSGEAIQTSEEISFTPFVGAEYGGTFEGPKARILEKLSLLSATGYQCDYQCTASPVATLTFKSNFRGNGDPVGGPNGGMAYDPNSDYVDTWELIRNTVQKELLLSDHPLIAQLLEVNFNQLRAYMANPALFDSESGFTISADAGGAASFDAANYLFDLFRAGVRSIEVKQPILRLTRSTSPLYTAEFNVSNTDRLFYTSAMINDSGVPASFAIPLISLSVVFINRTPMTGYYMNRADNLKLIFGWLKDVVSSTKVGTKRIQYVIDYKFGLWDSQMYGDPIG